MFCYVGKATKIFFMVVAALAVVGLVLGFGMAVRHADSHKAHGCEGVQCQPASIPNTIPAATAEAVPPILSPPSPGYAGQGSSNPLAQPANIPGALPATTAAAAPPLVSPPSPTYTTEGPAYATAQPSVG